MIKTFYCKETETIFCRQQSLKLPQRIQKMALRKLGYLNSAKDLKDLLIPPANRLEQLVENRQGQHSIRINNQWRICFKWHQGHAYHVEIVDYH